MVGGVTGLRARQISRSSVGRGLFPAAGNKRDSFPRREGEAADEGIRRYYLGQRDLSRVVKEKTGENFL